MMKKILAVTLFLLLALGTAAYAQQNTAAEVPAGQVFTVKNLKEYNAALAAIRKGKNGSAGSPKYYTLDINGDITGVPAGTSSSKHFAKLKHITVTLKGKGTLDIAKNKGSMFWLVDGQTLIIDGDLTLRGQSKNNRALISVQKGAILELRNGTITGNNTNKTADGGGVRVAFGTFTMHGGTISGNTVSHFGGGVHVTTIFFNDIRKKVVYGSFTMHGGTISGNTATGSFPSGGGVNGVLTMHGGTISGNTAQQGGGVNGFLTMHGGTISGNTANRNGGGVYVDDSRFTMRGGQSAVTLPLPAAEGYMWLILEGFI